MKTLLGLLSILIMINANATNKKNAFNIDSGKVSFKTKGWPSLITIKGEGHGNKGTLYKEGDKVSGELSLNLDTLKTGIELRDTHMRDTYLEINKYPHASLKLNGIQVPNNLNGDFKFKGTLTLHGVSKEIETTATFTKNEKQILLSTTMLVNLKDYKIKIPSYKGITVAEVVTVTFDTTITPLNGKQKGML